jgi:hypothetical protein
MSAAWSDATHRQRHGRRLLRQPFGLLARLRGMTTVVRQRATRRGRRITIWFTLACVAALALRVMYVHDKTWEYRLFPTSTPPKVGYHSREYSKGDVRAKVDAGFVRSGTTMGGGVIYAPSGYRTATLIDVGSAPRCRLRPHGRPLKDPRHVARSSADPRTDAA